MKTSIKVLLIEDDEDDYLLTRDFLQQIDTYVVNVVWESKVEVARKRVLAEDFDIFLIDYRLGSENGLDVIRFIRENKILTPAIVLTGHSDLRVDIDASSYGAADYLVKSELNPSILERSVRYALSQARIIKELDEKEKKYRSLFERSVDPIFLATSALELTDVNESFLEFFEYPEDDTTVIKLDELFANADDYHYFSTTLKTMEQIKDFEVDLMTKTGNQKTCLVNCIFIPDPSVEFCCYQAIIHDLTMRKQAERDMLIAERFSLTGKIARTIAHEVRNPLTNLNLALDQLRREIPDGNDSAVLYGDIIERNSNRIEQLVDEMLKSSKPKELQLELSSLNEVLDTTLMLAIDRINLNKIQLHKQYQEGLPRVLVDRDKMQIALLNIVINAIEAMTPGKGVLRIVASLQNRTITLSISDNGKGIPETDLVKLFDPFFTGKPNGMGLGLTSTKNILNSHCAKIEVNSQVGKGTTFDIRFELAE